MGGGGWIKHSRELRFSRPVWEERVVFDGSEERAGSQALLRKAEAAAPQPRPEPSVRLNPAPRLQRRPPGRRQMRLLPSGAEQELPQKPRDSREAQPRLRPGSGALLTICVGGVSYLTSKLLCAVCGGRSGSVSTRAAAGLGRNVI